MKKNYLSNPSYNYDQVNRASLACGPMVKWAIAQVSLPPSESESVQSDESLTSNALSLLQLNYADMLKRVEPLRNELQKLEDDAKDNKTKAEEVEQMIRDLEASIARYKEEYAVLISEAQAIKADLAAVEAKVCLPRLPSPRNSVSPVADFALSPPAGEPQHGAAEESLCREGALGEDQRDVQEPDVHHRRRLPALRRVHHIRRLLRAADETEPVHHLVSSPAAGQHPGNSVSEKPGILFPLCRCFLDHTEKICVLPRFWFATSLIDPKMVSS